MASVGERWIVLGAVASALGLAVAATAPILGTAPLDRIQAQQELGGVILVLGWAALGFGIHRFGRASNPSLAEKARTD